MSNITVVFPTRTEAKYFNRPGVHVDFCGVGLVSAAYHTARIIHEQRPDLLIMGGIAGVYKHSSLKIGDTVLVSAEREADLGFFYPEGFRHIADMHRDMDFDVHRFIECPYLSDDLPLPLAKSNSMNAAMAPFVPTEEVDIENMEGAAFFYVCRQERQCFFEVRSISNTVDIHREDWDYETSIKNMTDGINILLDYIQQKSKKLLPGGNRFR